MRLLGVTLMSRFHFWPNLKAALPEIYWHILVYWQYQYKWGFFKGAYTYSSSTKFELFKNSYTQIRNFFSRTAALIELFDDVSFNSIWFNSLIFIKKLSFIAGRKWCIYIFFSKWEVLKKMFTSYAHLIKDGGFHLKKKYTIPAGSKKLNEFKAR